MVAATFRPMTTLTHAQPHTPTVTDDDALPDLSAADLALIEHGPGPLDHSTLPPLVGECPACGKPRHGLAHAGVWVDAGPCPFCQAPAPAWSWEGEGRDGVRLSLQLTASGAWRMEREGGSGALEVSVLYDSTEGSLFGWSDLADMSGLSALGCSRFAVALTAATARASSFLDLGSDKARCLVQIALSGRFKDTVWDSGAGEGFGFDVVVDAEGCVETFYDGDDLAYAKEAAAVMSRYFAWRRPHEFSPYLGRLMSGSETMCFDFETLDLEGAIERCQVSFWVESEHVYLTDSMDRKDATMSKDASGFSAVLGYMESLSQSYLRLEAKAAKFGLVSARDLGREPGSLI